MEHSITFNIEYPNFIIKNETLIINGIKNIAKEENFSKSLYLSLVFMSDDDLLVYNKEYLNHDYYTDIITFPIEETDKYIEADLFLSVDRIKDNATSFKIDSIIELNRVIIHGVLHLLGYNDSSKEEQIIMRSKEDYYLSKLGFL